MSTSHQSETVQTDGPAPPSALSLQRAEELLRQMTVEEKAMQLSALYPMGLLGADGPRPPTRSPFPRRDRHSQLRAAALSACSFQRCSLTPITSSHRHNRTSASPDTISTASTVDAMSGATKLARLFTR